MTFSQVFWCTPLFFKPGSGRCYRVTTAWTRFTHFVKYFDFEANIIITAKSWMDQEKNSFYSLNRLTFFNLVHVCATSQLCNTCVAKRHFGTKLWARPQDVFGIAGSTWSRSLLSKDFARKSLDNNDRDQVEPAIPKTSCGLARSFVPKWRATVVAGLMSATEKVLWG